MVEAPAVTPGVDLTDQLSRVFGMLAFTVLAGCVAVPNVPLGAAPPAEAAPALAKDKSPAPSPDIYPSPPVESSPAMPVPQDGPSEPGTVQGEDLRELQRGKASWYGSRFQGRRTASGERYDMNALTAAHKTLPFGTMVRVRSLRTGQEVDVRINDRGPYTPGRVIDVSRSAAKALGLLEWGVKDVLLLVPASTPITANLVEPSARKATPRHKPRPSIKKRQ